MKRINRFLKTALAVVLAAAPLTVAAQSSALTIVSGKISDKENKEPIEAAFVSISGTGIATSTNAEGKFVLKFPSDANHSVINISHIGYEMTDVDISSKRNGLNIALKPATHTISQLTFIKGNALPVVIEALKRVEQNYAKTDNMISGFYRETVRKRNAYINVGEAVIDIYKTPYSRYNFRDAASVRKGRKILSGEPNDTIAVKLAGGPNAAVALDILKNPDHFLAAGQIDNYWFHMIEPTIIDGRDHYGIYFEPQNASGIYYGTLYVDFENYTISRINVSIDVSKREQATQIMLLRRPAGLYFRPEESTVTVAYKQSPEGAYLSYMRGTMRFRCDWKRRLFSTGYTVVSEMVTTDRRTEGVEPLQRTEKFGAKELLYDNISNFDDANFWADYNIIEPSESLENAVNRLKKRAAEKQ